MASKDFSNKLKDLRLRAGYSQKDVYEHFKIPQSTFSSWEVGKSEPSGEMLIKLCEFYKCDMVKEFSSDEDLTYKEWSIIEKYRFITKHCPDSASMIDTVLNNTYKVAEQMQAFKSNQPAIIEFHNKADNIERLLEYFRSASAGTGVFILGNEASERIAIPNTPENQDADFAIGVDGNSMEPDYHDGDIVLVSQKLELNHGDVGIFVINNKAYIKEYGETELISRNPAADNIKISEYDNIVCMGKVIGKLNKKI